MNEQHIDLFGGVALHVLAGQALVGQHDHPLTQRAGFLGMRQKLSGYLPLTELGSARHHATGMPSAVVIRYSFSPQYQRECAAQYP